MRIGKPLARVRRRCFGIGRHGFMLPIRNRNVDADWKRCLLSIMMRNPGFSWLLGDYGNTCRNRLLPQFHVWRPGRARIALSYALDSGTGFRRGQPEVALDAVSIASFLTAGLFVDRSPWPYRWSLAEGHRPSPSDHAASFGRAISPVRLGSLIAILHELPKQLSSGRRTF